MANQRFHKAARSLCLAAALAMPGMPLAPLTASAALLNIATVPLAKSAGSVNPNLLFLLDNSGSMAWEYLPDYVYSAGNVCFDSMTESGSTKTITDSRRQCVVGDPPFMSPDFNKVYYNPEFTYPAGVDDNKDSLGDQNPTSTYTDPYNKQKYDQLGNSVSTINLTNSYPDRLWCNTASRAATDTVNCKRNNGYDYPSQSYGYFPSSGGVTSGGSGSKSTSTSSGTPRWTLGAPYYYRIVPTEFCNDATLKTCIPATVPTGSFTYPAPVRFCKDPGDPTLPLVDCQGLYNATTGHKVPKFLGYVQTSSTGEKAFATITISQAGLSKGLSITSLTVNGKAYALRNAITVGAGDTANSMATLLLPQIADNDTAPLAPGVATDYNWYKATVSNNVITLTATSVGVAPNGRTIVVGGPAAGDPGAKATWKLVVGSDTVGPKTYRIGNIKIGTTIIANDPIDFEDLDLTSGLGQSSAAQIIANAINNTGNGGYTATWSGNEVVITAPLAGSTSDNLTVSAPASYAAIRATGTVIIGSAAAGTKTWGIATIKVGTTTVNLATPILFTGDLSSPSGQASAAAAVAAKIDAAGYAATATDNVVTIKGQPGVTDNGKAVTATASSAAKASAKLAITSANSGSTITSLIVDGNELLGSPAVAVGPPSGSSGSGRAQDLLSKLASRINAATGSNGGFTASYTSGNYYITVTAPTSVPNGATFAVTKTGTMTVVATGSGTAPNVTTAFSGAVAPMPLTGTTAMTGGGNATLLPTTTSRTYNGADAVGTIPTVVTPFDGGMNTGGSSEIRKGVGTFQRCDITATADCAGLGAGKFPRAPTRTDCSATTHCTYTEESKNFANWYAYYRTRMQSMKSAAGLAFSSLTDSFRVGFNTISGGNFLALTEFDTTQKSAWYTKFYGISPSGSTPLRTALSTAGQLFAGKTLTDPVQYACQQNFVLLTTDGYWNDSSCTNIKDIGGSTIGNLDGAVGTPRPYFDGFAGSTDSCSTSSSTGSSSGTLSDVAMYYYATDIRNAGFGNCTGATAPGGPYDVCPDLVHGAGNDNLPTQHMTTYTLGLGVDGTVAYQSDYQTATSGPFFDIKNGTANWPKPMGDSQTGIDDLWHAAVNGRGRYFSSKNPALLADDLRAALTGMTAQLGTGAAAATSNLEPQEGDNFSYVASYTTQLWTGNLEARTINVTTGKTNEQANWCIENVAANASKGTTACTGTLQAKVGDATDTRKIYLRDAADAAFGNGSNLRPFAFGNLTATEQAWFVPSALSQWALLSGPAQTAATPTTLVNYLRGQRGFEKRAGNTYQVYRIRPATLGDAVNSQPVFVSKPKFDYTDPGYASGAASFNFKLDNAARQPMVYLGTNEGMLHAFNATTGEEKWAYMPSGMLKNLWRLADDDYENKHAFRVDGSPTVGDVCFSNCADPNNADWHTILVGGYSSGARGYYALDISDPLNPKSLWEVNETTDADFGLSYGNPIITKRPDGKWVVLLTSGYNNASPGTGEGVLFVVEPATGTVLAKKSTGVGTTGTPSGLAKIGAYIDNANEDNTTTDVYGGDLQGNVWRFRLLADGTVTVAKIAVLMNDSSQPQPITTKPILTTLDDAVSTRYVIVATGKLLETSDTTDTTVQSLYGFEENYDVKDTIGVSPRCVGCTHGARDQMTGQEIVNTGTKDSEGRWQRAAGASSIPPAVAAVVQGCYVDLPLPGERTNVDMKLVMGNIAMVSNVPTSDKCAAGGESYMNFFDYKTCKITSSFKLGDALAVGMVVLKLASGYVVTATLSNDPTPQLVGSVPPPPGTVGFQGKRIGWRLLFD